MAQEDTAKKNFRKRRGKKSVFQADALIPKLVKSLEMQSYFNEYLIQKSYAKLFGEEIAKVSYPESLIGPKLFINVANSPWLMQLSFIKKDIIDKINGQLGRRIVREVVFRIGKVLRSPESEKPNNNVNLKNIPLDDETMKSIEESVRDVTDNELKKAIISAEKAYYRRASKS